MGQGRAGFSCSGRRRAQLRDSAAACKQHTKRCDRHRQCRNFQHARGTQFQEPRRDDKQHRGHRGGEQPTEPPHDTECREEQYNREQRGHQSRPENGRRNFPEDLSNDERVERRLIVPHFAVEVVPVQAQGRLRQLETFVRADLDRCPKRKQQMQGEDAP